MPIITIRDLLDAGVHFGAKASLWDPRMRPFIYGKRNAIHIIDVRETARSLIEAHYFAEKLAREGRTVLFVGTRRQAKVVIREAAVSIGMPYVVERWLGGTLTNNETIRSSIRRLDDIEAEMSSVGYQRESKKVQARHARERRRVLRNLEGVRMMSKLPDALFVIDPKTEDIAVREALRLNIPIVALIDTDSNPELVNLPIPGNDEGIRSIQLVVQVFLDGFRAGRSQRVQAEVEKAEEAKRKAEEAARKKAAAAAATTAATTAAAATAAVAPVVAEAGDAPAAAAGA
jgi:small subunit ribosomal protein S2